MAPITSASKKRRHSLEVELDEIIVADYFVSITRIPARDDMVHEKQCIYDRLESERECLCQ